MLALIQHYDVYVHMLLERIEVLSGEVETLRELSEKTTDLKDPLGTTTQLAVTQAGDWQMERETLEETPVVSLYRFYQKIFCMKNNLCWFKS